MTQVIQIDNTTPLYRVVYENLLRRFEQSEGDDILLPSRQLLAKEFKVGESTVMRAIALLKKEGRVYACQGKGTYLCQPLIPVEISHVAFVTAMLDANILPYSQAISETLDRKRYSLSICSTHADLEKYKHLVEHIVPLRFDGIIMMCISENLCRIDYSSLLKSRIPVVIRGYPISGLNCDRVDHTRQDSAEKIVKYILDHNLKDIGVLLDTSNKSDNEEFIATIRHELKSTGLSLPDERIFCIDCPHRHGIHPDPHIDSREQMTQMLSNGFQCETLICGYDLTAVGAIQAILNAGIRIPEDMKVISGMRSNTNKSVPMKITTVDTNPSQQAALAAKLLARRIEGYNGPLEVHYVPGTLIEGDTT